jgi:hypothetical protein
MKQGKFGVGEIASIVLILLVLVILIVSLTGLYGQTFKDSIKKIFGIQTEAEKYHEKNVKGETYFDSLLIDIQKCKNSKKTNCGCELELGGFSTNQIIRTKEDQIEMLDLGNIEDKNIYEKDGVLLANSTDIKNIDCSYDKNLRKIDNKIMTIYFINDNPEITYVDSNFIDAILRKGFHIVKKSMDKEHQIYKTSEGTCWLQETSKEMPSCY